MPARPYQLEFYMDAAGNSPVEHWFQDLEDVEAYALGSALDGLLRELGKKPRRKLLKVRRKALFRVFFHPHGNRLIVLLGAYDKSKHPSAAFQSSQIEIARERLADWLARLPKQTRPRKN